MRFLHTFKELKTTKEYFQKMVRKQGFFAVHYWKNEGSPMQTAKFKTQEECKQWLLKQRIKHL